MQIVGRSCESCGSAIEKLGGGDGCGSCDVVVCASCLKGTARCPSCQRPFDETRDAAPRAEQSGDSLAERGRRQASAVAFSVIGALVLLALLSGQLLSFPLVLAFGLLFFQLFRGRGWARWSLVALTALMGITYGAAALGMMGADAPRLLFGGVGLMFAWSAFVLALSPPLARFLQVRRSAKR